MTTAVIGGGSWGTALASVLAHRGPVRLWARDATVVHGINTSNRNPKYLSDLPLSKNIKAFESFEPCLSGAELVCLVVPSHAMREISGRLAPYFPKEGPSSK